ncbi:MAG: hypothetical protein FJZ87_00320 [Chloroflexi bacterium]|nr:hypothetical protein [Chloroflexota bacterium]
MLNKLESRAALYSTLALAFAYPQEGMDFELVVLELEDAVALAAQAGVSPDAASLRASLNNLHSAIRQLPSSDFSPAEEYTFLFHRQALCPPYESSYSLAGMEQSLADISGFYRAFGMQMSPAAHERVDHIGCELEFMAVLCAKEAHALRNEMLEQAQICRDARASFLRDHLGCWASAFASRVQEKARLPLYPALTEILASLIASEAEDLGVSLASALGESAIAAGTPEGEDMSCD